MKKNANRVQLLGVFMLFAFVGCSQSGALTSSNIEAAIKEVYKGNYTAKVTRINVIPSANSAEAEVTLTGFPYSSLHGRIKRPDYSGPAKAALQHIKTGWVLINLSFKSEYGDNSFNFSQPIE